MPKKKLTITNVRKKMRTLTNATYDLLLDKMGHANSSVPMSVPKLLAMHKEIQSASKRIK
jgi:hypothetical protein